MHGRGTSRLLDANDGDREAKRRKHWPGFTALHWASASGHADVVELLLAHGVDASLQAADGLGLGTYWLVVGWGVNKLQQADNRTTAKECRSSVGRAA